MQQACLKTLLHIERTENDINSCAEGQQEVYHILTQHLYCNGFKQFTMQLLQPTEYRLKAVQQCVCFNHVHKIYIVF